MLISNIYTFTSLHHFCFIWLIQGNYDELGERWVTEMPSSASNDCSEKATLQVILAALEIARPQLITTQILIVFDCHTFPHLLTYSYSNICAWS